MSAHERQANSRSIMRRLEELPELKDAGVVMAFVPLVDEADIYPLLRALRGRGARIVFPVLVGEEGRMDAHEADDLDSGLKPGRYGLMEPADGVPVDPRKIDLILVPAVAYDTTGHRLGRGGGYYDRFLAGRATNAFTCGVAFECQIHDSIPIKPHDCAVDALVTEKCLRRFQEDPNCVQPSGPKYDK